MSDSYTPRMCRASDRGYMDAFREGQKLERELKREVAEHSKVQAEAARLRSAIQKLITQIDREFEGTPVSGWLHEAMEEAESLAAVKEEA
jgi:hypothetical protein